MPDQGYLPIDPDLLPTPDGVRKSQPHGPITSGVVRGVLDVLGGTLGAAVEGAGKLSGSTAIQRAGQAVQDYTAAAAPSFNRPDLEIAPWQQGGASVAPWLEYQAAKQIPLIGAYILGGKGLAHAGVEAPEALTRVGAQVPRVLGGGGLRAGASFAERRAALEAGKDFAQTALGAEAVGIPIAAGSMYQEADNKPGGATREDAIKAAALSPFYAALDAVEPAQLKGLVSRGLTGGVVKRAVTAGLTGAASEVVQEGIQTALEQSFRTDLPIKDRMANIVDAAVTGGAIGGIFGGAGAAVGGNHDPVRALKRADPAQITNEDLQLALPAPGGPGLAAPNAQVSVSPEGAAEVGTQYQDIVRDQPTRPYENVSTDELLAGLGAAQRRVEAGNATDEIKRFVAAAHDELQVRNGIVSNNNIDRIAVGAVEPNLTDVSGGADSSGAPAPTSQAIDLKTLFKGVSPAARKAYAGAQTIEDIQRINNDLLAAGTAAKGHLLIAERLGVDLNEPAAPLEAEEPRVQAETGTATPVAVAPITQESTPEPAAPASQRGGDPSVQAKLKGLMGASIRDLRENPPQTKDEARLRLYKMWGGEGPQEESARDGLETAMRRLNMLNKDGQLSAVGRRIAHNAVTTEEAVQGAIDTGHSSNAAAFEAGARASSVKDTPKFDNVQDAMAFIAGHEWAIPKVATEQQTSDVLGALRQSPPPRQQLRQQIFNKVIDNLGINASLRPTEVAQLKSMVREGASSRDINNAITRVRSGQSLFQERERGPVGDFKGVTLTPTQLTLTRQQRAQEARQGEAEQTLGKSARLENDAEAIAKFKRREEFRKRLDRIVAEIDEENARAQELKELELKTDRHGVLRAPIDSKTNPIMLFDGFHIEPAIRVGGKAGFRGGLRYLGEHAPNKFYKALAERIAQASRKLAAQGFNFSVNIARSGDRVPPQMVGARAWTEVFDNGDIEIWLNDTSFGEERTGMSYVVLAHEMVHAVTMTGFMVGRSGRDSELSRAAENLQRVTAHIRDHFNNLKLTEMTEFQRDIYNNFINALDDEHEIMAWALTDPRMQDYLNSIEYAPGKSFWSYLVDAVRAFLGLDAKDNSALAEVLRAADTIMGRGTWLPEFMDLMHEIEPGERTTLGVQANIDRTNRFIGDGVRAIIDNAEGAVKTSALNGVVRKNTLGIPSLHGILEYWGKWFAHPNGNGLEQLEKAHGEKRAIVERFSQMMTNVRDEYEKLKSSNRDSAEKIVQLMKTTEFGINYTRPWREQSEEIRNSSNRANLEQIARQAHDIYRSLQARGHAGTLNTLRAVNDVLMLAQESVALHLQAASDPYAGSLFSGETPMDEFMRRQTEQDFDPHTAREWWANKLRGQIAQMSSYLGTQRTTRDNPDSGLNEKAKENLKRHIDDYGKRINEIQAMMTSLEETPYFHLGRSGEFFVSFKVPDAASLATIADRLEAGKFPATISRGTDKNSAYIRVESRAQWGNLVSAIEGMEREGLLHDVLSGQRKKDMQQLVGRVSSSMMTKMLDKIEKNDELDPTVRGVSAEIMRAAMIDLMPEMSVAKVLTKRRNIPGYSPDMMRSFDWRGQVGINAFAGMATAAKISNALNNMRDAIEVAEGAPSTEVPLNQKSGMRDILNEVVLRERQRATLPDSKFAEKMGSLTTAWFLGFNPAYAAVNMTQLGTTLLPELGAKHGFSRAFSEIAKATPAAFRIMRGVWAHGRAVSLDRAMDAVVTYDVLKQAVGADMATYLMRVVNSGQIDIGGPSRELMRAAEGRGDNKWDRVLRWSAMAGYYSETMSRLIAAIATRNLNPSLSIDDATDRAASVIKESMWDYSRANQGRAFGKGGPFGAATPLMGKFLQFQAQLTEKLFREVSEAIHGETAAERSEARRFLAGHLAAMTFLAGTLGWPTVTAFAAAFDKLKDLFDDDDEPSNVRAAYRNWLADSFGTEAGELIAHGVVRLTGADISQRIGEQDIIPYSRFMADRRQFKDSFKDAAFRTFGAPASAAYSVFQGAEKFLDGNIMDGLAQAAPTFLSSPIKAYRLSSKGFVDANGKALPMDSGAQDVIVQLFGFNPRQAAEDSEARGYQGSRKSILTRNSVVLRNQIAEAVLAGDTETARDLIAKAQQFDQVNPHFSVLRGLEESIRRRARADSISRTTGTPLGVSYRDPGGMALTRYANVEYSDR